VGAGERPAGRLGVLVGHSGLLLAFPRPGAGRGRRVRPPGCGAGGVGAPVLVGQGAHEVPDSLRDLLLELAVGEPVAGGVGQLGHLLEQRPGAGERPHRVPRLRLLRHPGSLPRTPAVSSFPMVAPSGVARVESGKHGRAPVPVGRLGWERCYHLEGWCTGCFPPIIPSLQESHTLHTVQSPIGS
jgi:hypothetical protein